MPIHQLSEGNLVLLLRKLAQEDLVRHQSVSRLAETVTELRDNAVDRLVGHVCLYSSRCTSPYIVARGRAANMVFSQENVTLLRRPRES